MRPALTNALTNAIREALNYSSTNLDQWVAQLDGAAQFWLFNSPLLLERQDIVYFNFGGGVEMNQYARFVGARDFSYSVDTGINSNQFRLINTDTKLNGFDVVSGKTPIPQNGVNSVSSVYRKLDPVQIHEIGALEKNRYLSLPIFNFRVIRNGVVIHEMPLTNKDQGAFQVATTTPLGANLYTQEVIENPASANDQWTYLGDGRWQLIGDGSANSLQFLLTSQMPNTGYVQFEIESISGGTMSCSVAFVPEARFDTPGIKAYYYSDISEPSAIQFKRSSGAINLVIKNIKHFDAQGVLVATMPNYTEAVWKKENEL